MIAKKRRWALLRQCHAGHVLIPRSIVSLRTNAVNGRMTLGFRVREAIGFFSKNFSKSVYFDSSLFYKVNPHCKAVSELILDNIRSRSGWSHSDTDSFRFLRALRCCLIPSIKFLRASSVSRCNLGISFSDIQCLLIILWLHSKSSFKILIEHPHNCFPLFPILQ